MFHFSQMAAPRSARRMMVLLFTVSWSAFSINPRSRETRNAAAPSKVSRVL
jgi:hypothetical protein